MREKYKFLEHTADIKFQAFGDSIEEVFKNSALALKEIIVGKIKIKEKIKKEFV
ncbi:archease, partial [Candidatus Pacearchaeota archaeon]